MSTPALGRLLIVDDEVQLLNALVEMLTEQGFETAGFANGRQALEALNSREFDVLLTDMMMSEMGGIELLARATETDPSLVGIVMTGQGTIQTAVEAMKAGAFDYILKPFKLRSVLPVISRAVSMRRLKLENLQLQETVSIYELMQAIAMTLDPRTILNKLADAALHQCHADELSILMPTPGQDGFYVAAVRGPNRESLLGLRIGRRLGIAGWVAESHEPLLLQGQVADNRFKPIKPRPEITSAISMPLLAGGKLVGVLNVNATQRPRPFSLGELKSLGILAGVGAAALESARLYSGMREAEQSLRESESRLSQLVEFLPVGVLVTDAAGRPSFVNPVAEQILGTGPADELMNAQTALSERAFLYGTDKPYPNDRLPTVRALNGDRSTVSDIEIQRDGTRIGLEVWGAPMFDPDGHIACAITAFTDISERNQLQQQLVQSQKMEAIGQLAGGVAHDFNNILTAIIGYGDLALDNPRLENQTRHQIAEIIKAGKRAAALTNQLLVFSRKQILQPKVVNLNQIAVGVNTMLKRLIGEDIQLKTALSPDLGNVHADPGQLEQVIMNLAVNARDAMPRGGVLTISTRNAELPDPQQAHQSDVSPGHYVEIAVADTGHGMDDATKARIFEPFFTTKEKGKGTGLGLSTVFGIVKQSNGHLCVSSTPGVGTTFKIYLPRVDEIAQPPDNHAGKSSTITGSETILVVDDDETLRELVRHALRNMGYKILVADGAAKALSICQQHGGGIDLLITDVVMPQTSGRLLVEHVSSLHPGIKTLFMSGYTDDSVFRHGIVTPNVPFLQKPFSPIDLAEKVREVLDLPHH